jgi:hypothetical protein
MRQIVGDQILSVYKGHIESIYGFRLRDRLLEISKNGEQFTRSGAIPLIRSLL